MKLTFLGAAHEVTGSCTLLEACGQKIVIDCGLEQGPDIYENCVFPLSPSEVDCLLLTHAHIDHSGKIPYLTANGYDGPIMATEATRQLCSIMLLDSAYIQESEARWKNRRAKRAGGNEYTPLYTVADATAAMEQFISCGYKTEYPIFDGITVRFLDAGHLLGSSSIEITVCEDGITKVLLFSGDVGNVNRPLIRDPEKPCQADIVVIESTYGDRLHGERIEYKEQLSSIINQTVGKGGNVVIPSFAVGRTQELLYLIREMKAEGRIDRSLPVVLDSPLAVEATKLYAGGLDDYYDQETLDYIAKGENILSFENLRLSVTKEDSVAINEDAAPKVIISSSGMCEAGRIRHHLKHNLWRAECTILFVGYQSVGTLGRILVDGAETVKLFGEEVCVNARIATLEGISGHADRDMLLDWLRHLETRPEAVFVNHGSDTVCDKFAAEISQSIRSFAVAPFNGACYDLSAMECLNQGNQVRINKEKFRAPRTSPAFEKLVMAGKQLMAVIERNRGGANKDLGKFTSQINELCRKWER